MAKKKAATATANSTTAIDVGKTMIDPITKRQIINFKLLEPAVQKEVAGLTQELQKAITNLGMNYLKVGEVLAKIEMILKPRGVFTAYLNSLPGFNQTSAYRYINAYNTAKTRYPEHVLEFVMASGIKMIGNEQKPFGVYQDVVKKLPPPQPTGHDEKDKEAAANWVKQVEAKYRESRKRGGTRTVNADALKKEAFTAVLKRYAKVPDKKQLQWLRSLFSFILGNLQFAESMEIDPQTPPNEFVQRTGEAATNGAAETEAE